jgi:hypothetical protein
MDATASFSGTATLTLTTSGGACGTATASKTIFVDPNCHIITLTQPTQLVATIAQDGVTTICNGQSTTISVTISGGTPPYILGGVQHADPGTYIVTVTPTTTTTFNQNTAGFITDSHNCTSSPTGDVTITVNQPSIAPTVLNTSNSTLCNTGSQTATLTQTGGTLGTNATWVWYTDALFTTSIGSSSAANASLSVSPTTTTTYYLRAEGTAGPCTGTVASIASVTITVNETQPVSVSIASSDADNTICDGTSVTFTATPTNGGSSPSYQWKLNGNNVGTNQDSYTTSTLANGDVVTVVLTSNITPCATGNPATSNGIATTVIANQPVSVSIASSDADNTICDGTSVTFTATPTKWWYKPILSMEAEW